ncbi:MAG TPA: hypothetical protein DIC34_02060 [Treponema sp.]|nr:MAG: hypothetical protein A2001_03260 [Treponema sp. GWC1_61_84]OHE73198.1 MAG: hypothetical protein A2413_06025 [Treponema sp. RIFOXYC1_FULL_61_9]HCM25327.1 hypothetical protein [Treponema sp.]
MLIATFLRRFFTVFFQFGSSNASSKRALSALFDEISRRGPSWYEPWTDRLDAELAEAVERARRSCARMSKVYLPTMDGRPEAVAAAADAVLNRALAGDSADPDSLASLSFEAIRAEVPEIDSPDAIESMDRIFKERLGAFRSEAALRAASGYRTNARLASLCRYDFAELLDPFAPKQPGTKGRRKTSGAPLASALADLHFLVSGLKTDGEARDVFLALRDQADTADYPAELAGLDYDLLAAAVTGPLRADGLGRTVRAIQTDPDFELREDEAKIDIRAAAAERAKAAYTERRTIMAERLAREALDSRVRAVFGDSPLLPVQGWTEELSAALSSAQLPKLSCMRPLSVVKSFLLSAYFPRIRPSITAAVVDLDFSDRIVRTALSDEADAASRLSEEIGAFEESVSEHGRSDFSRLVVSLASGQADLAGKLPARRVVEEANAAADRIVQDAFTRFGDLRERLDSIRDDLKSRRGEIVANAAVVNIHKSEIPRKVEEAANLLALALDLLRMLAVDSAETQKTVDEAGARGR